jgi:hypothetical protein
MSFVIEPHLVGQSGLVILYNNNADNTTLSASITLPPYVPFTIPSFAIFSDASFSSMYIWGGGGNGNGGTAIPFSAPQRQQIQLMQSPTNFTAITYTPTARLYENNAESYTIPGTGSFTSNSSVYNHTDEDTDADTGGGLPELSLATYDVTHAIEVLFPAHLLNAKLGIYKTSRIPGISNSGYVLDPSYCCPNTAIEDIYDPSMQRLRIEQVALSADEFIAGLAGAHNIVHVGALATVYQDFAQYIRDYFQLDASKEAAKETAGFHHYWPRALATLMDISPAYTLTNTPEGGDEDIFDTQALWQVMTATTGANNNRLAGNIYVSDLTQSLRYACEYNPFGNRDPTAIEYANAIDASDPRNYGVYDGFLPNDLIFIPNNGFTLQFNLHINYGTTMAWKTNPNVNKLVSQVMGMDMDKIQQIRAQTTQTKHYIGRTVSVPLLLRLVA